MQEVLSENLEQFDQELVTRMLEELPAERRLQGLPPEERLRGLSPDEVLRALPREFVAGLNEEEAVRLRKLLEGTQTR